MWFNNLIIFSYQAPFTKDLEDLNQQISEFRLKPCPPHAKSIIGFDSIVNQDVDTLIHTINGCHLGALTQTQRLLPTSVLKAALEEKKQQFESENQKSMSRSESLQAKEQLEFDLLPKAFTVDKKRWFYIDTEKQWIVVNSAAANQASDVISYLIKALGAQGYTPMTLEHALPALMKQWLLDPESLAFGFSMGAHCQLVRSEDDKTTYNCKDIEAHHDHLCSLLEQGYQIKSLELLWEDKLSFSLMDNFVFKRVKCLNLISSDLKDNRNLESQISQLDADLALLTGEMRVLLKDFSSLVGCDLEEQPAASSAKSDILSEVV